MNIKSGKFVVKDSDKKQTFKSGAMRDVDDNKPRYELIPVEALKRVAMLYTAGAKKYSEDNWRKGMPYRRAYASLLRHAFAFSEGNTAEDHLASVIFNAMAIMYYQEKKMDHLDNMPGKAII